MTPWAVISWIIDWGWALLGLALVIDGLWDRMKMKRKKR